MKKIEISNYTNNSQKYKPVNMVDINSMISNLSTQSLDPESLGFAIALVLFLNDYNLEASLTSYGDTGVEVLLIDGQFGVAIDVDGVGILRVALKNENYCHTTSTELTTNISDKISILKDILKHFEVFIDDYTKFWKQRGNNFPFYSQIKDYNHNAVNINIQDNFESAMSKAKQLIYSI